jgi:alpha-glucosidase
MGIRRIVGKYQTQIERKVLLVGCLSFGFFPLWPQSSAIRLVHDSDVVEIEPVAVNILRVQIEPNGISGPRTLVMDPALASVKIDSVKLSRDRRLLRSAAFSARTGGTLACGLQIRDAKGSTLLSIANLCASAKDGVVAFDHDEREAVYGIRGLEREDRGAGIQRPQGATITAGVQGDGGAPFFFTKRYGVLVDSDGGVFDTRNKTINFREGSRRDVEFFVIVGKPLEVMAGLSQLTGRPPMPPKWTLGFLNSQWGVSETELRDLTREYAQKQIPISGFILDFDWKAWGEDDYGEWRWNSTAGAGSYSPNRFPDGASGEFAAEMLRQGIHLAGILKPRILVNRLDGKPTEASGYATAHGFWFPNEIPQDDYVTHRPARNIDFANPDARKWYWEHLIPSFHSGMTAWWNDEADQFNATGLKNFQFFNMARTLYDGQRSISEERVWSINRAYYLGANRYGYAEWSGDIETGFQAMAYQRSRMVAALDLGLQEWSMDTGGFRGRPTPENYARWIEFASFVPVDRVHGDYNQKRQPWVYGPVAEAAATHAIRLRYTLMPYIYSNARVTTETGIGIVRPLFWEFPEDDALSNDTRSWMFGDALLVSPVVTQGETTHEFYLPPGTWFDYATGKRLSGGRELAVAADAKTWLDIPIFVRDGSIFATQDCGSKNDLICESPLTLEVFPSTARKAVFILYNDDGHTYAYERGEYFRQEIDAEVHDGTVTISFLKPTGTFKNTMFDYSMRVHRLAHTVARDGHLLEKFSSEKTLWDSNESGWTNSQDRFGPTTVIRISRGANEEGNVVLKP